MGSICLEKRVFFAKEGVKRLVTDSMREMGHTVALSDDEFEATFNEYDVDSSGKISRGEMAAYMRKVINQVQQ